MMRYHINDEGYVCEVGDDERYAFSGTADSEDYRDEDGEIDYESFESAAMQEVVDEIEASMGDTLKQFALPGHEDDQGTLFVHMTSDGRIYARVSESVPV